MRLPRSISTERNGQYCFVCFSETVERFFEEEKTFYRCSSCSKIAPRSIVIDDAVTWWIDADRTYWHESVGVVIKNSENKIFCILRQIYPFAYALPAGHLDKGEDPHAAALREVKEEIGLDISVLSKVEKLPIPGDECRRGSDDHLWHIYTAQVADDFIPVLSDEASTHAWFSKEEILLREDIVYPLKFIVQRLAS